MAQQRHRFGRSEVADGGADDERQEGAGHSLGERAPGAVVDADAPGFEPDGDAARQQPVGRDERRRSPGRFDRLAQDQRHGFGFVLRRRRFDQGDAGKRAAERRAIGLGCEADATAPSSRMDAWPR